MSRNQVQTKAILFDLDNTLVHRRRSIDAYADVFVQHHATHLESTDPAFVAELITGRDNGGYLPTDSPHPNIRTAVATALSEFLHWRHPVGVAELAAHWVEHFPAHTVEMPGAHSLISTLHERSMMISIISNGTQRSRERTLACMPFAQHVSLLVSSEIAGWKKPDPRIFFHTAQALGVQPGECIYVGDHPINDIQGAASAGMTPVWFSGFHPWPQNISAPGFRVDSFAQVLPLLER